MWLNDIIINAALKPLKSQFSHIGGLQDTLLQVHLQFLIMVADSLGSTHPSLEKQKIVASLVHTSCPEVKLRFENVELQNDQNSCGLLAMPLPQAFASQ